MQKYQLIKHANRKRQNSESEEETIYVKPEDEILHKVLNPGLRYIHSICDILFHLLIGYLYAFQLSSWSFSFPLQTQQVQHHEASRLSMS